MVDVVIPTVPGREDALERCIASLHANTPQDVPLNEIIVKNSRTCGWGWRRGFRATTAPYILFASDDHQYIGPLWARACMETADAGQLACPRVWSSDGHVESQGGDMSAPNHLLTRWQRDKAPVDFTTVPFLSREQVEAIGLLDVHYGSDVWISYRGRQLGYETVLRHAFKVVHHQSPIKRGAGMTQGDRDVMDMKTVRDELAKHAAE